MRNYNYHILPVLLQATMQSHYPKFLWKSSAANRFYVKKSAPILALAIMLRIATKIFLFFFGNISSILRLWAHPTRVLFFLSTLSFFLRENNILLWSCVQYIAILILKRAAVTKLFCWLLGRTFVFFWSHCILFFLDSVILSEKARKCLIWTCVCRQY